jgi:hypothetical protein
MDQFRLLFTMLTLAESFPREGDINSLVDTTLVSKDEQIQELKNPLATTDADADVAKAVSQFAALKMVQALQKQLDDEAFDGKEQAGQDFHSPFQDPAEEEPAKKGTQTVSALYAYSHSLAGEQGGKQHADRQQAVAVDRGFLLHEKTSKPGPKVTEDDCGSFAVIAGSSTRVNFCKPTARTANDPGNVSYWMSDRYGHWWAFWYLPDLDILGRGQGFDTAAFDQAVSKVQNLQASAAACSPLKTQNRLIGWEPSAFGLGHNLLDVLAQFTQSYRWQLPQGFLTVQPTSVQTSGTAIIRVQNPPWSWSFANNPFCDSMNARGWDCYFQTWTQCPNRNGTSRTKPYKTWRANPIDAFTPLAGYEKHGSMWASAVMIKAVWRLTDQLMDHAQILNRKRAMGIDRTWIGIHVRHGDSGSSDANAPWLMYLEGAKEISSKYGASKIYLATDDPKVAKECKSEKTLAQGFTCMVASGIDRGVYAAGSDADGGWIEERMKSKQLDKTQMQDIPVGCFIDWEMLAECGYFIGDLSRAFFRVPVLLHIARRHQVPPILSVVPGEWSSN